MKTLASATKDEREAIVRYASKQFPKVTAVGIGKKIRAGKVEDELVLQFSVGQKIGPEALDAKEAIPPTLEYAGFTIPTDVIERTFKLQSPTAVTLKEIQKDPRKTRVDPLRPGVSVGHPSISAGTLGAFVRDRATREVLVLSNWHVLHASLGAIGDDIVQPGRHDDNRTDENKMGTLARSFLGLAGDCAVARPSGRGICPVPVGFKKAPTSIADPAIGDRVMKSGRTTEVTHGVVTRIHTIVRLDYGLGGDPVEVGGFEIGPDPKKPASNDEISMGGDSGSVWVSTGDESVLLGLHFAGETEEPAEFAIACYASSVFQKLEIEPLPDDDVEALTEAFDRLGLGGGFDPTFIGKRISLPYATASVEGDYATLLRGGTVRQYTHFSLAMSQSRRFARWVAWNVDGGAIKNLSRNGIPFTFDPAYEDGVQAGNDLYKGNDLDRGHIARRADLVWGRLEEAKRANRDSFFFTNMAPQLADFNQSSQGGLWGRLEDAIFEGTDVENLRLSIFGGPIFADDDFRYRGFLVPRRFWKIIAFVDGATGDLTAKAYVLTQDDLEAKVESLGLEEFKIYQVRISSLQSQLGLTFGPLAAADNLLRQPESLKAGKDVRRIERFEDI